MRHLRTGICGALLGALVVLSCLRPEAGAVTSNPYSVIAQRNVFDLQDPPPPPTPPPPEPEPPPNIRITGITTIMGDPRALVKIQIPAKPPEPAREESYILLAGGPPQGGVEVLEIVDNANVDKVKVRVRQGGKETWLGLERDTVKPAAPPQQASAQQAKVAAAQTAAQKLAAARAAAAQRAAGAANTSAANPAGGIPSRPIRTGQAGVPGTPGYTAGAELGTGQGYLRRRDNRVTRDYGINRDEQVILIEMEREVTADQVATGIMPPLPPTELTPPDTPPELNPVAPSPEEQLLNQLEQGAPY